ncbi:flagellar protein FliT [Clostridium rectalis]|uniref:flagellar protein FliT n=1 Tax=Clostridium rectalis TaxID=2040295 RepID=UPI000F63D865|nr:flagellar protein FliT [Clostridium rectalis]
MCKLEKYLNTFKLATIDMIETIENEDYNSLESLMEKRENIIDKIDKLFYKKEDFIKICNEIELLKWDKLLNDAMVEKKQQIKKEIAKVNINRNATNNYNKKFYRNSVIFSKKI